MMIPTTPRHVQAEQQATRAILAIGLFVGRFGRTPAELGDLVAQGLLPRAPIDPCDGLPFRYSRDRGLLWSVGWDGKDGNGEPPMDYVWRVPVAPRGEA